MKPKHVESERQNARATLRHCGVPLGANFHALEASKVDLLLKAADRAKYRKPKNVSGSRGRYFNDLLQCRARRLSDRDFDRLTLHDGFVAARKAWNAVYGRGD